MKGFYARGLLFLVAVPAIVALIVFLPHARSLAFIVLCYVMSGLATIELSAILTGKGFRMPLWLSLPAGLLLPSAEIAASYADLFGAGLKGWGFFGLVFMLALTVVLSGAIIPRPKEGFEHALQDVGGGLLILVYPGAFMSFLIRICFLQHGRFLVLLLLCAVFIPDALAYAVGTLFGKKNSPRLQASPSKTIAGFITIPLSAAVITTAGGLLLLDPLLFGITGPHGLFRAFMYPAMGLAVGCASILGDLAESVLKRSANLKDSGRIVPGRGGVLDSIDSLMFGAPFFFYLIRLLI